MSAARSAPTAAPIRTGRARRLGTLAATAVLTVLGALLTPAPATAHEGDAPSLLVSSSPDRSAAASLSGATVRGSIYPFLPAAADITLVEFWLDNPTRSGSPRQAERQAP